MFSRQMNLMSLYSAEVPRIRTKKPNSLTITVIENREDMRWMLVDLLRVSMESVCEMCVLRRPASTIGRNYVC